MIQKEWKEYTKRKQTEAYKKQVKLSKIRKAERALKEMRK